jgi:hypothetical protein
MAPIDLNAQFGEAGTWIIYLVIGFGFGFILESAGFGDSRRLAAQFYWRNLAVLKVMLSAILVAAVVIFWASALGFLDYDEVWVNPTYLWPGILGGLIMGVGFIFGGFCPGTSLVGLVTLKLDALWFVIGAAVGIILFGESVHLYEDFWHSSNLGRLTLQEWTGLPAGVVILCLVGIGVAVFWLGDIVRKRIWGDTGEN